MNERYAVDILASRRNGTLYVGFTSDLVQRVAQHKAERPLGSLPALLRSAPGMTLGVRDPLGPLG